MTNERASALHDATILLGTQRNRDRESRSILFRDPLSPSLFLSSPIKPRAPYGIQFRPTNKTKCSQSSCQAFLWIFSQASSSLMPRNQNRVEMLNFFRLVQSFSFAAGFSSFCGRSPDDGRGRTRCRYYVRTRSDLSLLMTFLQRAEVAHKNRVYDVYPTQTACFAVRLFPSLCQGSTI